jgi:hypothetical protein
MVLLNGVLLNEVTRSTRNKVSDESEVDDISEESMKINNESILGDAVD